MKMTAAKESIDPFAIWIEPENAGTAALKLGWADRVYETGIQARN
jgi:hypothetical protein